MAQATRRVGRRSHALPELRNTGRALDTQYALEQAAEDASLYAVFYAKESEKIRANLDHRLDVPFGLTLAEHSDVFPAPGGAQDVPILVYIHGGYWQLRTSKEFGFVARGPASKGVPTVVVSYTLCPKATIDEVVCQTHAAMSGPTRKNARSFGGDPERIYAAGHSAGI